MPNAAMAKNQRVYARHGRELMGWPVCHRQEVPYTWTLLMGWNISRSISRRQGRFREGGSEGSRSAKLWADGQKQHIRPSFRVS